MGRTNERGLPVLDDRARRECRDRLGELRVAIDDADDANDPARAARARHEHDWLARELSGAFGPDGRERLPGDATERARKAVTMRVRDALARLDAVHPSLARHLRHSIVTGRVFSYQPEHPMRWTVGTT